MRTILNSILLMSLCSSATAPAMAINRADNNKEKSNFLIAKVRIFYK